MPFACAQFDATDDAGNLLTDVIVDVRRESGGAQSVFADREGTIPLGSTFTVANGKVVFFAPGNAYRIRLTKGDYQRELRYFGIGLASETDMVLRGFRGEWNEEDIYAQFEMVTKDGIGFFVSTFDENEGHEPDSETPGSNEYWAYWAQEAPTGWVSFATLTVIGGTANAIEAITSGSVDPNSVVMYVLTPEYTNTASVKVNGTDLLTYDGLPLEPGWLAAGAPVLLAPGDDGFRLVMDHRFTALKNEAEAARDAAQDIADDFADMATAAFQNRKAYSTWSALNGVTGSAGDAAEVLPSDTGTHTGWIYNEATEQTSVPNAGVYVWDTGKTKWRRVYNSTVTYRALETGIAAFMPDGSDLPAGEYFASIAILSPTIATNLRIKVLEGTGSARVVLFVNGQSIGAPKIVSKASPHHTNNLNLVLKAGDVVSFGIDNVSGVSSIWAQIDGGV